jgi:hypothetical protein
VTGAGNAYAQTAGTTNVSTNGTLSAPNVNVTGGTLRGNGTVAGNLNVSSAGTVEGVNPNNGSPDTLTVNGTYNRSGGTLAALLQGTGAGQIGQVHLTNGTSLNLNGGNLARASGSISYAAGQTFSNVVTFQPGQLFGTFTQLEGLGNGVSANLGGGLTLEALYNNAAGNITLQVVNTPASNTITWNDGTGYWTTDTTKWTPAGPPVPTSDVVIGSTNTGNVTLSNDATINTLLINPSNQLTVNGGSTLTVATGANSVNVQNGGAITLGGSLNTLGTVTVASSGSLGLSGGAIDDATLAGAGTFQTTTSGTLHAVTVSNGRTFTGLNGTTTNLVGTITNNGLIAEASTGGQTDFILDGNVTLTGNGTVQLSNSSNNRIYGNGSNSLTIDTNQTVAGAGQLGINNGGFGFALDNKGTINANQAGGTLQVAPTQTVTNTGTMEASNGGTLHLLGSFANTGGLILGTGANSTVGEFDSKRRHPDDDRRRRHSEQRHGDARRCDDFGRQHRHRGEWQHDDAEGRDHDRQYRHPCRILDRRPDGSRAFGSCDIDGRRQIDAKQQFQQPDRRDHRRCCTDQRRQQYNSGRRAAGNQQWRVCIRT